jgi:4-hydroxy-tetrahydrodipicolinate reductase
VSDRSGSKPPLRAIQIGLGPIGIESARYALRCPGLELVGAVDISPALSGRDLAGILAGASAPGAVQPPAAKEILVEADLSAALARTRPDIALHTTGSRLAAVAPQIETVLDAGVNLVSTTEELSYPWRRHAELAARLDALARSRGCSLMGTGVNPGFAMDTLALVLTSVCRRVDSVSIRRVVDAASRRGPLQRKVGAGLSPAEFRERVARGELGHVGLVESLDLLAACLGFGDLDVEEAIEPVIAGAPVRTPHVSVETGQVAGIHHTAFGRVPAGADGWTRDAAPVLSLDLRMYVGAADPVDETSIAGDPPVVSRIAGGIAGDAATVAILVNAARRVVEAPAGLRTMAEIAPPYR